MNKNKLIFAIIGTIILAIIVVTVYFAGQEDPTKPGNKTLSFSIWTVGDKKEDFSSFITDFKTLKPEYKNSIINVESFSNYKEYYFALMGAIIKGETPDLFVLNNNEKNSIFSAQTLPINPSIINPNDFRKKYKGVFSEDLIYSYTHEGKEKEYLIGIPVGYETLGIFYNGRYVKAANLETLSGLNNTISSLKKSKPSLIPIGLGNGSTVESVADILLQFFMLEEGVNSITQMTGNKIKEALATYLLYGDENSDNNYNSRFVELKTLGQNNIDLFSKGETFMIVGYPSLINKIDESGYSSSFLRATPFPHFFSGGGKALINYNYFVINKDTENIGLAYDFLSFVVSDTGAQNYLNYFPYYLPSLLSLESDKLEEKIHKKYKVVLKDFYNSEYLLSSFDKGVKNIFDTEIIPILDNSSNYEKEFESFKDSIVCKTNKFTKLENLSKSCE